MDVFILIGGIMKRRKLNESRIILIVFFILSVNFIRVYSSDRIGSPLLTVDTPHLASDTLPPDFPEITMPINNLDKAYPGYILMTTQQGTQNYLFILDKDGKPYKWVKCNPFSFNFNLQDNGLFAHSESQSTVATNGIVRIRDNDLNIIESIKSANGLTHFPADCKLLPNGNVLLLARVLIPINMRSIIPTGDPNATVIYTVLQELDKNRNAIFQWSSLDYIDIEETLENLENSSLNYTHMNAFDVDTDGNFLLSLRHPAQITKIDRNTGEIIWRLGGKKNEFTFIGENEANAPYYFNYQHHILRQANGNITFFDNGNKRTPPQYSRGLEYKLDEDAMTAELVWEYRNTPDIYSPTQGSVQILPNGNYLIGWGSASLSGNLAATELTPQGEVVMTMQIPQTLTNYRVYKVDLPVCQTVGDVTKNEVLEGNEYKFNTNDQKTGIELKFLTMETPIPYNSFNIKKYDCAPMNPEFDGSSPMLLKNRIVLKKSVIESYSAELTISLNDYAKNLSLDNPSAYFRATEGSGTFTQLESNYNDVENKLTCKIYGDGELVIGQNLDTKAPLETILYEPRDRAILSPNKDYTFRWSPKGRFTNCRWELYRKENDEEVFQIGFDMKETTFKYKIDKVESGVEYIWQVVSSNENGSGAVSERFSFTVANPFISMISPNGGEVFYKDNLKYIIDWEDNLDDLVLIELMQDGVPIHKIADSVNSPLNIIQWAIPKNIASAENYKIRISSVTDGNFSTISENEFSILDSLVGVKENEHLRDLYGLSVFPVPAENILSIRFNKPYQDRIEIILHDIQGNIIRREKVINDDAGELINLDIASLRSGVYFLELIFKVGRFNTKIIKK